MLDSYGLERGDHVRQLTSRIKEIGHVICERDPVAAAARDERILAEGGGKPRTITRQEIVPSLRCGLLSKDEHPARGTLFPQPWIITVAGRTRFDKIAGAGWLLVIDGRWPLLGIGLIAKLKRLGVERVVIGCGDHSPDAIQETDGVVMSWFDRNTTRASLVRPDHYVFGVATDDVQLERLFDDLEQQLK